MTEVSVQLGLYGGSTELTDFHVVAAHTRTLADGTTAFVSEHLRWNRGRQGPRLAGTRAPAAPVDHPSLFGGASPTELPEPELVPQEELPPPPEVAGQLWLW
jgi:hypothetical protein